MVVFLGSNLRVKKISWKLETDRTMCKNIFKNNHAKNVNMNVQCVRFRRLKA